MKTTKVLIKDMRADAALISEIHEILAPSYEDARPLLGRELGNNTEAYLLIDDAGRLDAFFMVGWGRPARVAGSPTVYLGLSACRRDYKGFGLTVRLYRQFIQDAIAWENVHAERLLLWATTAHPLIVAVFDRFAKLLAPLPDGTCPEDAARLAWELRQHLWKSFRTSDHPLVLRGVAADTLYSATERARLKPARSKLPLDLFGGLQIEERHGDRLLLLGRVLSVGEERE